MRAPLILALAAMAGCGSSAEPRDGAADRIAAHGPDGAAGAGARTDAGSADRASGAGGAAGAPSGGLAPVPDAAAPVAGMPLDTFDTAGAVDVGFEPRHDVTEINLADPTLADAGVAPALLFDGDEGSPSPGSMEVVVPFSGPHQYVQIQSYVFAVPQDWSGRTLHVRLKVDAGSVFQGVAQLYVNTGVSYIAGSTALTLAPGSGWQDVAMNVDHPMTVATPDRYSAEQVVLYGVELDSGSAAATPATFHLDSFSLE